MPTRRGGRSSSPKPPSRTGSTPPQTSGSTVLAFVLGAAVTAGAGYLYLHSSPHQSSSQPPPPHSAPLASRPPSPIPSPANPPAAPHAAIPVAPFGISEDVFEAGAHLYANRCATCHGTPSRDAAGTPPAPQLWRAARTRTTALAPGELRNLTALGNPARGMPAYNHVLTETQIWQLALLLKNASVDLPDPVLAILNAPPRPPAR